MQTETRVILVTGGTRGIGAAIAKHMLDDGACVAVSARKSPGRDLSLAEGERMRFFPADVSSPGDVSRMVQAVLDTWGRLDGLVCAAGINVDRPFLQMTLDDWYQVLDVSLTGTFLVCQAAAPALKAARGAIITFASQTAFRGRLNGANYCSAKAGVVALTKCIAQELAPDVRANVIVPGLIETPETLDRLHLDDPAERALRAAAVPLKRIGEPAEVAEVAAFLLSDRASYITGQTWWVNGGMVMD